MSSSPSNGTPAEFTMLMASITSRIAGRPLDADLERDLSVKIPANGPEYRAILDACQTAIAAGWMCSRDAGGIKFGRVIKPSAATHGFSVDVVDMQLIAGPHHRHPNGEIDLVMPLTEGVQFDERGAGWLVYGPGSAHAPTVTRGRALILYLLPAGAIEFTKT
jgi:Domain of unknown function (DUF4863)